jgi:hypothetical protein
MVLSLTFAAFVLLEIWPLYNAATLLRQADAAVLAHVARAAAKGHCPATGRRATKLRYRGA